MLSLSWFSLNSFFDPLLFSSFLRGAISSQNLLNCFLQFSLCLQCSVFYCFFTSNLILFVFFKLSFWFLTQIHCSLLTPSYHDLFIFSQLSNWWKDFAPILPAALCCCLLSVAASACCLLLLPAACSLHLLGSSGTRMLGQGPGARVSLSFYELDCVLSSDMTL